MINNKKLIIGLLVLVLGLLVLTGCNPDDPRVKKALKKDFKVEAEAIPNEGYPPTVPHSIEDRQDCLACHEKGVMGATVTSHPERPNCVSCHVTE
ncbi:MULTISPECIES: hypothetical protein [unclassified Candidatus Frackibacter]|uniref:hypothetical protein n=1 Tax=unclassified Candidatus Frackibacter TaxID=2648818 RepID=UPI000885AA19|nr:MULTISPECIES: hypothetical protein [unclassified Candidatus Frackibacter]SDC40852.1 periplasmic nitrate reductase subunit NapB [Candidatus Frackibacter sp. WG11]SEM60009.1 periplasmic nitrate reductase subunit NapB [Candidatus Frackibacter sp. WG12]SFL62055.1 periplasmic nitrate reductase subunit NapB [Candidatus Frackibacter sp. WG13]